jgi:hypothetical protein
MNAKQRRIKKLLDTYIDAMRATNEQFDKEHQLYALSGSTTWIVPRILQEARQAADQAYVDLHAALIKEGIDMRGPGSDLNIPQLMRYLASN